ncbi:MAG: nucleoside deaminase [Verrucomicrobiota bacterium]
MPSRVRLLLAIAVPALALVLHAAAPAAKPLPDDPSCTAEDRKFMTMAYDLARKTAAKGNSPVGAVLVHEGKVVFEYANTVVTDNDVTMHAETGLISHASPKLPRKVFEEGTLYTSTEPCIMCCGSIRSSGLKRVVFGQSALQTSRLYGRPLPARPLECREVFTRLASAIEVRGPLMEEEAFKVRYEYLARNPATK